MIAWLLHLIYPAKCVFCRKLLSKEETDLCLDCRKNLPYVEQQTKRVPFCEKSVAAFYYEDKVRDSVLRYKFRGSLSYADAYELIVGSMGTHFDPELKSHFINCSSQLQEYYQSMG